ncbi:DISARM system SNF2-like helicase DrmD [Sphingomonas sp. AX6]|uniref:DISARM system SNF2-like helicase DrmD n=1 Tax=Sphingomonas sp. AX6 TaxID=2653171 RepID=UPI0012F07FDB|nr:DISARM system SNF2-like helicase DrmD [Sphingomonas sp. AX6]VXC84520.1 SNF2 family N-terminal domain-containing protein [Sphingomonas sp. AX6]
MKNEFPQIGSFVAARGRTWLVDEVPAAQSPLGRYRLSCVDDDAQGETVDLLWGAEIDATLRDEESWANLGARGSDDAAAFAAYLRTIGWRTATAADRDLFQAPFRAGIRLDAYQLLPLRKALRLPRVNLLIADDVGLGKTVEAGLILRELLLRRRVDLAVVVAPAAMTQQWKEELASKFGLAFEIVDRGFLEELRRRRGFGANPWATGSRFILSHSLISDESYVGGLRDVLEDFRARSLLILDEAHHAAPAGGGRYAIESQFTKDLRDLAGRFEHRLFLSATPHNGHSNSFATLLELLDPQRFTRGMDIRPDDLDPVMVRRLKSDLRALGEAFPERIIEPVTLDELEATAPELRLAEMLANYGHLREQRIGTLTRGKAAQARLAFVGLQQRLLSSIPAFARTLAVHLASLDRFIAGHAAATAAIEPEERDLSPVSAEEEEAVLTIINEEDDRATEAAATLSLERGALEQLRVERTAAVEMLAIAEAARGKSDARITWLHRWIRDNLLTTDGQWGGRRLLLFTEYEDTRRYVERQLSALLGEVLDRDPDGDNRIDSFTGITSAERREAIKRAFNDATSPLRILICTDAAREGINLQAQCHDLFHIDLPWNPSRLEQRNGRIDRKLQPSPVVTCRYFIYAQRPEDVVLDALVRKTDRIHRQLGSAGQVLEKRIAERLGRKGIAREDISAMADRIRDEEADERVRAAVRDLDDGEEKRFARLRREQEELTQALERARARVGVAPDELMEVVSLALQRAGGHWDGQELIGDVPVLALDPDDPAFAQEPSWRPLLDELRARPAKRGERPAQWRAAGDAKVRRISFAPAILSDGRDAADVVQVHLEHRLVRRLLSRFLSVGFQQGLTRACILKTRTPGPPRVVLIGRLALYAEGAQRLHEELVTVTADWRDRTRSPGSLRPLAESGDADARILDQLFANLSDASNADASILERVGPGTSADVGDLRSVLDQRAAARGERVAVELLKRGEGEARSLEQLLQKRIDRIRQEVGKDDRQLALDFDDNERRQRIADRRSWEKAATLLDDELVREPARLRASYAVKAQRIEPVGIVYLWPDHSSSDIAA